MAYPTIVFNASTGSDTQASGAGPATAVFGTKAQTRNEAGSLHVGFFEGTPPDLSGVATDGSAALYINTASGRKFAQIVGVKDTQQSGNDAAINSGNNQVTVGDTTGISVDDVIMISGAGTAGADFYQRVSAVNSGTLLTLYSPAGTTVSGANWVCPKKVQLRAGQGVNSAGSDLAWAIGGKRATLFSNANSRLLLTSDLKAGWVCELADGHTESFSGEIDFGFSGPLGDTTDGRITIRGEAGAAVKPVVTNAGGGGSQSLVVRRPFWAFYDFKLVRGASGASHGITLSGTVSTTVFDGMDFVDWSNTGINASGSGSFVIKNCLFDSCSTGFASANQNGSIKNCRFVDCTGNSIDISGVISGLLIEGNVIVNSGGKGIDFANSRTDDFGSVRILNNIIYNSGSDGIDYNSAPNSAMFGSVILGNIIVDSGGYALNFSHGSSTSALIGIYKPIIDYNAFYIATSGFRNNVPAGDHDVTLTADPFVDAANGDFNINSDAGGGAALRAAEIAIP